MNQKIKLSQGIKYGMIGLSLFAFFLIWPLGIWQKTEVSKSREIQLEESGPISVESNATQVFLAEGNELKAIKLYVVNEMQFQTITFRIYDSTYKQIWETLYVIGKRTKFPGFVKIPIGIKVEKGQLYFYTIEGLTQDLYVAYEETATSGSIANGGMLYGGQEFTDRNIISRFFYKEPFSGWMIWGIGIVLTIFNVIVWLVTDKLFSKKFPAKNIKITIQRMLQCILNPLLAAGTICALWFVFPGRKFGTGILNYGFYYLGISLAALVLFFAVNYKRIGESAAYIIGLEEIKEKLPQWFMAVCFAKILWSCYEYMNGLYDVHHAWAVCKILTWLCLAYLCTLRKEDWLRLWNPIYLVSAAVIAYRRYQPYVGLESEEAITGRLQVKLTFVAGFVALQILISVIQLIIGKRKPNGSWNYWYLGIFATVITGMIIFRNTREWPIIAAVMFGVFYYGMWLWEKRNCFMQVFCNGIILNFVYMVYYCLRYRPYLRFRHNRFGMGFHTVTMTGCYLALVLCAVIVKVFAKYYKTRQWQECWKELSLLGIGNIYLILTLSRTGYLAAFAMEIFMCIFFVFLKERKKMSGIVKKAGVGIAVTILFFPIVFTAQRILPAVANDPVYSEVEIWEYVVEKGEPKDSELYIDITAFMKVAGKKLFGLDTGNISLSSIKPIYVTNDDIMVASEAESMEEVHDISNGRLEIFREYIKEWNLTGHEDMSFRFPNGSTPAHAHNTFLQMIHDHGLITGSLFLIFGVLSFFMSIWKYSTAKQKKGDTYNALGIAVILAFALAGMVEWIFHFANPLGFSMFIVIIPLLFQPKKKTRKLVKKGKRIKSS